MTTRTFLGGIAVASTLLSGSSLAIAGGVGHSNPGIWGGGRIDGDRPVPDRTVKSPSDVAIAVDDQGGTFVCTMAGPDCKGFLNLQLMMIESRVEPGEFTWTGPGVGHIDGHGTVVLVPDTTPAIATVFDGIEYHADIEPGGPGQANLVLTIPAFEAAIKSFFGTPYGNTGGYFKFGAVKRSGDVRTSGGISPFRLRSGLAGEPVGSSRVDLQACKLEYSIVSPK